ncbi:type II toxin-antitoxin system RelE/ParE family toxin [Spirosoma endophyticum]|uniref:RelE toxin of RelE / RelB toxin-antitoxin system n=1 Tax=Spirosoma endophyticum TaxID=662367 RepID=A0A1I2I3J3_9BACT|nr:type II toxin-antitoxin system RelE/ParE family toxin [Spirosoma endophyticum]SFF36999.1 RelE toxin of RelE / RelB toxin-antitoxin system [Spirosoma endophyticum]
MSYDLKRLLTFDRQAKRLAKKYPSLKTDLRTLFDSLREDPTQGAALGKGCYKVRMAIASKKQGKSGGARVITFVKVTQEAVYLLAIYDKSEKENLDSGELDTYLDLIEDDSATE